MRRLTKRHSNGIVGISQFRYYNYDDFQKMARKLADYEDLGEPEQLAGWLEELIEYKKLELQGLLLKLPCKVGATVYSMGVYEIQEFVVTCFDVDKNGIHAFHKNIYIGEMGFSVFATKEEAEQELKRLEGEQCKV